MLLATPLVAGVTVLEAMQTVADQMAAKYDMGISMAYHADSTKYAVASGYSDEGLGIGAKTRKSQPDDLYVWGSTTKMYTGPAVLQLVDQGVVGLTDLVTDHVSPEVKGLLEQHLPKSIAGVQIEHLLHMSSGLSDYDGESYSAAQFADRTKDFSPLEIISSFIDDRQRFKPGESQSYCSTNYILLGFVLAHHAGSSSWSEYDQRSVFPASEAAKYPKTQFVASGACKEHTPVHGFLEGYSTASIPKQDVWNVSCLGGWSAGNLVAPVDEVAAFTLSLTRSRRRSSPRRRSSA